MKKFNPKKRKKGFTILEAMIAIFVIIIGVIGASIAIQQTLFLTRIVSSQLIASYLAQEGVEIVRNIRDGNWLEGVAWDSGLTGCEPEGVGCQADYTNTQSLDPYTGEPLKIDGGFYNYQSGTPTPFTRKITIASRTDPEGIPILDTRVLVNWQIGGETYQVLTIEYLYNWK